MKRIVFICLAAGLVLISSILLYRHLATPSDQPVDQTAETSEPATNTASQLALSNLVESFGTLYGNTIGLMVIDKTNSTQASYNADSTFVSASLYKLFVAYGVLAQIDDGQLNMTDKLTTGSTIEECLGLMITVSDNDCGSSLGWLIDWETLDGQLAQEGYSNTILNNYDNNGDVIADKKTTATDVALLLERLYDGELLESNSTNLLLGYLESQTLNYALPTGLDDDLIFAHKTGILDNYSHDVGILSSDSKDVIVVMMTSGWTDAYTESIAAFTDFGQKISTYMKTSY